MSNSTTGGRRRTEEPAGGFMTDFVSTLAGVLLIVAATFEILQGAAAIANDDLYASSSEYLFRFDLTVWGWVHVVIGVLCFIVAVGILRNASWAQISGIIVAGLSAMANFAFLPYYPIWAIIVIAINVLIIYALSTKLKDG